MKIQIAEFNDVLYHGLWTARTSAAKVPAEAELAVM